MRFVSFDAGDATRYGLVVNDQVVDLVPLIGNEFPDLKSLVAADAFAEAKQAAESTDARIPLANIELAPVIPNPGKILCIGLNYESHRKETGRAKTEHPSVFTRFADTQIGHNVPIVMPKVSDKLDYEGELAIIIGKPGRYIEKEDALDHITGYSVYNDATIRDWQRHTIQFTPGKNFPGTGAFGPWMVTADEIPNPYELELTTRLNGEVMQNAKTSQMIFDVATIIEYCSAFTPLSPGDVIATGTPGGVGFKRDPQIFMKPGDVIEVVMSGIGVLRNTIVKEQHD